MTTATAPEVDSHPRDVQDDEPDFVSQVEAAWNHVALGSSVKLSALLSETRKRGLSDADVKEWLQEYESDPHCAEIRGWRNEAGETFLYRNESAWQFTVASVNEMFVRPHGCGTSCPESPEEPEVSHTDFREQARDVSFRNQMIREANPGECGKDKDCSVAAGMLLAIFKENCIIDQMEMVELESCCFAAGMKRTEFAAACGELKAIDMMEFIHVLKNDTWYARTANDIGNVEYVDPADALIEEPTFREVMATA
jgi:hypothetical protein